MKILIKVMSDSYKKKWSEVMSDCMIKLPSCKRNECDRIFRVKLWESAMKILVKVMSDRYKNLYIEL